MTKLSVDGDTHWYEETGAGPSMVFVHGGWMNSDFWRPQVERFADSHRVVTYDVRGHGRTGATGPRRYSVGLFADDLERLLDHLDVDRPVLCGLSLGSMVVQEYLRRHPERAAAAILAGPIQSLPPVALPRGAKSLFSPLPALEASLSTAGPRATFQAMLAAIRTTTGGPWLTVDPAVRSQAIDSVGRVSRAEFAKIFGALYEFEAPDLSGVETPTLVVYGDQEVAAVKRQGKRIAASVADGTRTVVPDAAHLANQDNAAEFNDACTTFLAARGSGPA